MAAVQTVNPTAAHQLSHQQPMTDTSAMASSGPLRGAIDTTLNFYLAPSDGAPPHNYVEKPPRGQPQRNFGDVAQLVHINDARGHEQEFDIDQHAFATLNGYPHNSKIDWDNDASVREHYYPEVEKLLFENIPGTSRVLLFDHTIRRANPNAHRAPVTRVHIDQTQKSASARVRHHLPEEADDLLKRRYRIINVWRPINGAVESFPLAFAEASSVPDTDMIGVEHRYPDRSGETAAVQFNKDHRWWYWSGVDNDERILLQCFDSKAPGVRVPHTAFQLPGSREGMKPRESIEVRALVFE